MSMSIHTEATLPLPDAPVRARLYEVRESTAPGGGVLLGLHAEGQCIATAHARSDLYTRSDRSEGEATDSRELLEKALVDHLRREHAKVELSPPTRSPADGERFVSRYVYRDADGISAGLVWYDVPSSTTGPNELPTLVRNKMRWEVHRQHTEKRPTVFRTLLRILDEMSG